VTVFVVVDESGAELPGEWDTAVEAMDKGLLGEHMADGFEVAMRHADGSVEPLPGGLYAEAIFMLAQGGPDGSV
jgi:hypothetical protein